MTCFQVWKDGAAEGLGWIHLRFPTAEGDAWEPPTRGWHIDGHVERLDSLQVVTRPLLYRYDTASAT